MAITIKTTGFEDYLDPSGGAWVKALIMGEHGVGKTPSAVQWPLPIIADCEGGLMSVAKNKVPYAEIHDSNDMDELLAHLKRECAKPVEKRRYQTLIIDCIDTYQRRLIQQRLQEEKKETMSGWTDWGWLDGKMQQLAESLLNLGMNVVVNMHTKDERNDDGEISQQIKKARLKGDFKDAIYQDFDLIGQMEKSYVAEKGKRVLKRHIRWHSEPQYPVLRDRSNKLPKFTDVDFTDQDYFRIFNAIFNDIEDIPQATILEEVATQERTEAVGPDEKGGPVDPGTLPRGPAKKAAAKKAPAKKAVKGGHPTIEPKEETPASSSAADNGGDTSTDVEKSTGTDAGAGTGEGATPTASESEPEETPTSDGDATSAPASPEEVAEQLGAEVVSETEKTDAQQANSCGYQPPTHKRFEPGHPGCGADLTGENPAKVNLALLRAKVKLCSTCLEEWKTQQQPA